MKNLIEQSVASGLIYLNSSARDFQNPELRPYLDKYVRGSGGYDAEQRVKLMKLLWDTIGSEFGARHEPQSRCRIRAPYVNLACGTSATGRSAPKIQDRISGRAGASLTGSAKAGAGESQIYARYFAK